MSRGSLFFLTGSLVLLAGAGCSRSLELDTISSFTDALAEGDVETLKDGSSVAFQEKALRTDMAADNLKLLKLPKGEVSVLTQKDISETEKLVTVTVGKKKRKVRYKLVRELDDDENWVVDEIIIRQTREGLTVAKSVSDQMDLLLSVREFLDAWNVGTRNEVLAVATPEFQQVLSDLPAGYLAKLTGQAIGERKSKSKLKPDVQMDEDIAVVTLPGDDGDLVISYRLREEGWKVSDLAVEARTTGKHIPSVAKMANVVRTTGEFLSAYSAANKKALQTTATRQFFNSSLAPADLSMVQLPASLESLRDYEVTLHKNRADFVVRRDTEVTRFSLIRDQNQTDSVPRFFVDDVTIYEMGSRQEKRLSALFTAHATMLVFSEALGQRNPNLPLIRKTASRDFNKRVWEQVDGKLAARMPLAEIENARPTVLSTTFEGAVTEITVKQGALALTYVLRDENRQMRVDDVHLPVQNRPTSLKTNLELMIPIRDFVAGIDSQDIPRLQRTSSDDMNRIVWRQTDSIPQAGYVVPSHLQLEMSAVKIGEDEALVVLGDARHGAQIKLVREYGKYVIDDVLLIAGPESSQRAHLKRTLRLQLAERGLWNKKTQTVARPTSPAKQVQPATFTENDLIPPPIVAPLQDTFGSAGSPRGSETARPSAN
ncbi:MAG: hypothetical protein HOK71_22215 [Planctomycetaceae bacterium]|nr:hypothetical protein [Planctomycetaceae bacterium]